ncbi:unnamed protein product, partial [Hapterophycus canaliculatus]
LSGEWPWVFEQPGRCIDLPAEEVFSGFDGFGDLDLIEDESSVSEDYSKVSREVRNAFYSPVSLDDAPAPELIVLSEAAAARTGIPPEVVIASRGRENKSGQGDAQQGSQSQLEEAALALSGAQLELFHGAQPFASSYGGHQFGNWAGQLGDGRVATLGEISAAAHESEVARIARGAQTGLVEIQLKGIGKTPFSRGGDGKAVLGTCLREFLFSEAFLGLGLSAALAISVCTSGESATVRDSDPKNSGALRRARGAILCRAAPSFLRFGSFELPARRGEVKLVRKLADYCLRHLGPHLASNQPLAARHAEQAEEGIRGRTGHTITHGKEKGVGSNGKDEGAQEDSDRLTNRAHGRDKYVELLVAIVEATAQMVAEWQAVGFCHGVLNTDNFTLLGLALDFGPCGFMERYNPAWSPNEGDSALRYAFRNQPDVSAWNCERLAEAFSSIVGVSGVEEANGAFSPAFDAAYTAILQRKLGLADMELGSGWIHPARCGGKASDKATGEVSSDARFVLRLFWLMSECRTDYTGTWRALLDVPALSATRTAQGLDMNREGPASSARAEEDRTHSDDEETLRPLRAVLKAAGASSEQMQEWVIWLREYSSRIDTQGIGRLHPKGVVKGRAERQEIMRKSNPDFVLRATHLEQALGAAERGDMELVRQLEERLSKAYTKARSDDVLMGSHQ